VEMSAVMAKCNPFAEKAGMKKIVEQQPPKEAKKMLEVLNGLGFNSEFLGSTKYVSDMLERLNKRGIQKVKDALNSQRHPRFLKSFSNDLPFGTREAYKRKIANASIEKLAGLIKICSFLMQTKAYLFWQKEKGGD
jgi:hypothetical protein